MQNFVCFFSHSRDTVLCKMLLKSILKIQDEDTKKSILKIQDEDTFEKYLEDTR